LQIALTDTDLLLSVHQEKGEPHDGKSLVFKKI